MKLFSDQELKNAFKITGKYLFILIVKYYFVEALNTRIKGLKFRKIGTFPIPDCFRVPKYLSIFWKV